MKLLLTLLIITLPFSFKKLAVAPVSYYVSSSTGSDTNNGLTPTTAFASVTKINSITKNPGDAVYFNRGDVFYGGLTLSQSGVSGNPITVGAYGTGANPIITGFTTNVSWTNLGSNIWQSTNTISTLSTCNMVLINGVTTGMGRTPNAGSVYYYQSHADNTSFVSSNVNSTTIDWAGSELVYYSGGGTYLARVPCTGASGSTLTFNNTINSAYSPTNNNGFFIENDVRTLDVQNEWFYDASAFKLKVYSTSNPGTAQIASVTNVVTITGSYINMTGIDVQGANNDGVLSNGSNNLIRVNSYYCGNNGMETTGGTNVTFDSCHIQNTGKAGMFMVGSTFTITNDSILNAGKIPGLSYDETQANGILTNCANTLIQYCYIKNTLSDGIKLGGINCRLINNSLDSTCLFSRDHGGIYTGPGAKGSTISYNIVTNILGYLLSVSGATNGAEEGIYLDEGSDGNGSFTITYNTCVNASDAGIKVHKENNNRIEHNECFGNKRNGIIIQDETSTQLAFNDTVRYNNFFVSTPLNSLEPWCAQLVSVSNNLATMCVLDSNGYVRPLANTNQLTTNNGSGNVTRSLASWQTIVTDPHSFVSPVTTSTQSDMINLRNPTQSPMTVTLGGFNYIDSRSVNYPNTITLAPYTSASLIKQGAFTPTPGTNAIYTKNKKVIL